MFCLRRAFRNTIRSTALSAWYFSVEEAVVETKYILPGVSKRTAAIVKILYENDDRQFTTTTLWDALQDYNLYETKGRMKFDLKDLKKKGYVTHRPPPNSCHKTIGISGVTFDELNPDDRWKQRERRTLPATYRNFLLPGMLLETAPVVKYLLRAHKRQADLTDIWEAVKPMKLYNSIQTVERIVNQLKTMRYVRFRRIPCEGEESKGKLVKMVYLSDRIVMEENKVAVVHKGGGKRTLSAF